MSGREVLRMLAPSFANSVVACLIGLWFVTHGHRTVGIVLLLLGAGVGLLVRLRLMMRGRDR